MPTIVIQGTPIDFPNSASSPDWSPAVIQFAQAVETALNGVVGPFDISPQVLTLASNANTNLDIPNLAFSTSSVRGAFIKFAVYRKSTGSGATTVVESGNVIAVYNADATGNKWEWSTDFSGDSTATFNVTDTGQVQISTTAITGTYAAGFLTYSATALTQT
jgi:hypothetical protein